ncbi:MAG: hypothetical protein ACR2HY_02200 [Acidimicrobiales bacterium]
MTDDHDGRANRGENTPGPAKGEPFVVDWQLAPPDLNLRPAS